MENTGKLSEKANKILTNNTNKDLENSIMELKIETDEKSFLRVVPLEKLISPNTKYVSMSQIKSNLSGNKITKDIIVLESDDSDSVSGKSVALKGSIIISESEKRLKNKSQNNSSYKNFKTHRLKNESERKKSCRTASRRAKMETIKKIKLSLAIESDSMEFDSDSDLIIETAQCSTNGERITNNLEEKNKATETYKNNERTLRTMYSREESRAFLSKKSNMCKNNKYFDNENLKSSKDSVTIEVAINDSQRAINDEENKSLNDRIQVENRIIAASKFTKKIKIILKQLPKSQLLKHVRKRRKIVDKSSVCQQKLVNLCSDSFDGACLGNIILTEKNIQIENNVVEDDSNLNLKPKSKRKENSTIENINMNLVTTEENLKKLPESKNLKEILKENNYKKRSENSIITSKKIIDLNKIFPNNEKKESNTINDILSDKNLTVGSTEINSPIAEEENSKGIENQKIQDPKQLNVNSFSEINSKICFIQNKEQSEKQTVESNYMNIENVEKLQILNTNCSNFNSSTEKICSIKSNENEFAHLNKLNEKGNILNCSDVEDLDKDDNQNKNKTGLLEESKKCPNITTNEVKENIDESRKSEDINNSSNNKFLKDDDGNSSEDIIKPKPRNNQKKYNMSGSNSESQSDQDQIDSEVEGTKQSCSRSSSPSSSSASEENDNIINKKSEQHPVRGKKGKNSLKKTESSASEENIDEKFVDSDDSGRKKKSTKRKRIKAATDSSDDDGDDGSNSKKKLKRKNIRKIIKTQSLNFDTKRAAEEEKERRKRIEERQRLYNSIYEKPETTEISELILDFEKETKKALLKVDSGLLKQLKPHQVTGVKFMWDACFESLEATSKDSGSGCILAHCMGLGKTLQIITLTHTLITNSQKTGIERVLVITPLSTLTNWAREFHTWLKFCKNRNIEIYDMSKFKEKNIRTFKLNEWYEEGGVCIIGYDMYRILSNDKIKGLRKKQKEILQKVLVEPGPDLVVCDEGHLLKNEKTSLSQAVTKMHTKRRIVLTGTPLQNNLKEYYCMIQFIKPNLLGTYKEYLNRFVNPITNGQYMDSTERDLRLMKHRSHILHKLLEGCIQRRDYSVLAPYLPPKHEYVVYITLSEMQRTIYEYYMTKQRSVDMESSGKGTRLFYDFQNLRRIWTHPMCLRVNSDLAIKKRLLKDISEDEGSLKDFIDDNSDSESSSDSSNNSFQSDKSVEIIKSKKFKTRSAKKNGGVSDSDIEEIPPLPKEDPSEWWCQMVPKGELDNINHSPKLVLLMSILSRCEEIGDKILLFSQSLQSLDVIEEFLSKIDKTTQGEKIEGNINEFRGCWQNSIDYFRLDGSCSVESRELMCKRFNDITNLRARLFLISTRAGSLGINLVAANRVIIFDVSWNPSHDTQSIFRVYRFGQNKPCYIYRFIAMGTMEQKVYERQVTKQATAKRVIDEQQIERHYNQNDLLELYSYELEPKIPRETPIFPKDRMFAEILTTYDKLIFKYHEHDSLLENQINDNLSEDERKAAWDEYEIEKTNPPMPTYTNTPIYYNRQNYGFGNQPVQGPVTSNKIFGFRTDILLRLLNMKVGRDFPTLNPAEVVEKVPTYLQQLYTEMNAGNPTMYRELLELHTELEMPQGYYMNPLLYANQAPVAGQTVQPNETNNGGTVRTSLSRNPYANRPPPTINPEIVEID